MPSTGLQTRQLRDPSGQRNAGWNSLRWLGSNRRRMAGKDEHGLANHSDKEKFCNGLNGPKTSKRSERALKTLRKFRDFQAEYSRATATKWPPPASVGIGGCGDRI